MKLSQIIDVIVARAVTDGDPEVRATAISSLSQVARAILDAGAESVPATDPPQPPPAPPEGCPAYVLDNLVAVAREALPHCPGPLRGRIELAVNGGLRNGAGGNESDGRVGEVYERRPQSISVGGLEPGHGFDLGDTVKLVRVSKAEDQPE